MKKIRKRAKPNALLTCLIMLITFALTFGGFYFYNWYSQYYSIPSVNKLIEEKEKINYSDKDSQQLDTAKYVNSLPEYRTEYGNQNIMGKLEIPGLNINALITQADDNKFYLNYNLHNKYDEFGAPFFDYRNSNLASDKQINIYGHNTEYKEYYDRLPLINLEAYMNKNIFDNYKNIYLSIDEKQMKYKTVAIKIVKDANHEHMKLAFSSKNDFVSHARKLLNNAVYKEENLTITANDRLLVLQICHYNPKNSYLIVIAKEI